MRKAITGLLLAAAILELLLTVFLVRALWDTDYWWLFLIPLALAAHNGTAAFCLSLRKRLGYQLLAMMLAPLNLKVTHMGVLLSQLQDMVEESEDREPPPPPEPLGPGSLSPERLAQNRLSRHDSPDQTGSGDASAK